MTKHVLHMIVTTMIVCACMKLKHKTYLIQNEMGNPDKTHEIQEAGTRCYSDVKYYLVNFK